MKQVGEWKKLSYEQRENEMDILYKNATERLHSLEAETKKYKNISKYWNIAYLIANYWSIFATFLGTWFIYKAEDLKAPGKG